MPVHEVSGQRTWRERKKAKNNGLNAAAGIKLADLPEKVEEEALVGEVSSAVDIVDVEDRLHPLEERTNSHHKKPAMRGANEND